MAKPSLPVIATAEVAANGADTAAIVQHLYKECRPYQWLREVLENSRDAGAKRFVLDIEPQAQRVLKVKRALIVDDGCGMNPEELLAFARLGATGREYHFGVGAKVSILPWNPLGMVVVSYQKGRGALIWIQWDEPTRSYKLRQFDTKAGASVIADPEDLVTDDGVYWGRIAPKWAREHGTAIVLLGSRKAADTVLGDVSRAEGKQRSIVKAINTRYWDLSDIDAHAWNPTDNGPRRLIGARHFVENVKRVKKDGALRSTGHVLLDKERVRVDWFLWDGERPNAATYGDARGFVGVKYENELYERLEASAHLGLFGIVGPLQKLVTIVITPPLKEKGFGVESTTSRQTLTMWEGYKQVGLGTKVADWGTEFVQHMPDDIKEAHRRLITQTVNQYGVDDELLSILGPGSGFDRAMRAIRAEHRQKNGVAVEVAFGDMKGKLTGEGFPSIISSSEREEGTGDSIRLHSDPRVSIDAKVHAEVDPTKRGKTPYATVESEVLKLPRTMWNEERDSEVGWAPIRWQERDIDGKPLITVFGKSPFVAPLLITLDEERKKRGPIVQGEARLRAQEAIKKLAAAAIVHVQRVAKDMKMTEEETREMLSPQHLASVFAGFIAQRQFLRSKLRTLGGGERED